MRAASSSMPYLVIKRRMSPRLNNDIDVGIQFLHTAEFSCFEAGQFRSQCGQFDVEVLPRQIKVRRKRLRYVTVSIPFQVKRAWLILPFNAVVVEQISKFCFGRIGEVRLVLLGLFTRNSGSKRMTTRCFGRHPFSLTFSSPAKQGETTLPLLCVLRQSLVALSESVHVHDEENSML